MGTSACSSRAGDASSRRSYSQDLAFLELLDDELDMIAVRAALADPGNAEALDWDAVQDTIG